MRREPAFTVTALATLALGIGLNTAIFSVAYGVLWRPLPYAAPDRLIMISTAQRTETGVKTFATWSPTSFDALRPRVTALDDLAAYASNDVELTGRGEPLQVPALDVSPNFFATLGVRPARGRAFLTGGAAADDDGSAIVSDRLWRTSLKADPAVIGQTITVDGLPRTIVGVLPPDFTFRPAIRIGALPDTDIFLSNRWLGDTDASAFLSLLGRMKTGVTQERAEDELTALVNDPSIVSGGALAMEGVLAPNVRRLARTVGLQEYGTEPVRLLLLVLLGAVSFVLLIACVNVANLQMARLSARRGELVRPHGARRGTPAHRASAADGGGRVVARGRRARRDARPPRDPRHAAARAAVRAAPPRRHRASTRGSWRSASACRSSRRCSPASSRRCASAGPPSARVARCTPAARARRATARASDCGRCWWPRRSR